MTYGTKHKASAEALREYLSARYPTNRYEVQRYDTAQNAPQAWGVVRYVPYCEQVPERFDGFVWHDYTRPVAA